MVITIEYISVEEQVPRFSFLLKFCHSATACFYTQFYFEVRSKSKNVVIFFRKGVTYASHSSNGANLFKTMKKIAPYYKLRFHIYISYFENNTLT